MHEKKKKISSPFFFSFLSFTEKKNSQSNRGEEISWKLQKVNLVTRDQRDSSWKKRLDPTVIEAVCGKFEGPRDETLGNHLWRGGVSRGVRTLRATDCRGTRIIEFPPVDRKSRRVSPRDRRTEAERETVRPTPLSCAQIIARKFRLEHLLPNNSIILLDVLNFRNTIRLAMEYIFFHDIVLNRNTLYIRHIVQ